MSAKVKEKDFWMYIEWTPQEVAPEVPVAAETTPPVPEWGAPVVDPNADIAALAAEAWGASPEWEAVPPETTPTWEVVPEWGTPPPEAWTPPSEPGSEVSWEELQRMLDTLWEGWKEATADIKTAVEEVKKSLPEADVETAKKLDDALQKIAELEANKIRDQKTIDVIKSEYEKTLNDKISLEYWTASDSKIAQIVNDDPDVKALIAAKLATWDDAREKLNQARKAWRENVSWATIDSLIAAKKEAETGALWGWEDVWAEVWKPGEKLYV